MTTVPSILATVTDPPARQVRHLVSIRDLTDDDLYSIVARGARFAAGESASPLAGRVVGTYFVKTSTRTRTAFTVRRAAARREDHPVRARTTSRSTPGSPARTPAGCCPACSTCWSRGPPATRRRCATGRARTGWPVINAMSAEEHPTQALADLTTLLRRFGRIERLRLLYLGEANNTATALALALTRFPGVELELRTPAGYGLPAEIAAGRAGAGPALRRAASSNGTTWTTCRATWTPSTPPAGRPPAPASRTRTGGGASPRSRWTGSCGGAARTRSSCTTCPAHRGEEVTAEVLDGPASIAFEQAENKLYSAMAVLDWCRATPAGSGVVSAVRAPGGHVPAAGAA